MPVLNRHIHDIPKDPEDPRFARTIHITRPHRYSNPYVPGQDGTREGVLSLYRQHVEGQLRDGVWTLEELAALKGSYLVCVCDPKPCHGHVLEEYIEMAYEKMHEANVRQPATLPQAAPPLVIVGTGHRPQDLARPGALSPFSAEEHKRRRMIAFRYLQAVGAEVGPIERVVSGMALGWDMALAEAALGLNIPVTAAIPFEGQDGKWPEESRKRYQGVLSLIRKQAGGEVVLTAVGGYSGHKMMLRNDWMLDRAAAAIERGGSGRVAALWSGKTHGGTWNTVQSARRRGLQIDNLWGAFAVAGREIGALPDLASTPRSAPESEPALGL